MCETILAGHTDFINVIAALTDTHLISGSWDGTIRVWDVTHGACLNTMALGAVVWTLAVLPDGRVASGLDGEAEQLCIWNPSAWERVAHVPGHMSAVSALAVSLDGRLVSGDDRGTIIVSLLEPH
jgi:WD40 repeat protein